MITAWQRVGSGDNGKYYNSRTTDEQPNRPKELEAIFESMQQWDMTRYPDDVTPVRKRKERPELQVVESKKKAAAGGGGKKRAAKGNKAAAADGAAAKVAASVAQPEPEPELEPEHEPEPEPELEPEHEHEHEDEDEDRHDSQDSLALVVATKANDHHTVPETLIQDGTRSTLTLTWRSDGNDVLEVEPQTLPRSATPLQPSACTRDKTADEQSVSFQFEPTDRIEALHVVWRHSHSDVRIDDMSIDISEIRRDDIYTGTCALEFHGFHDARLTWEPPTDRAAADKALRSMMQKDAEWNVQVQRLDKGVRLVRRLRITGPQPQSAEGEGKFRVQDAADKQMQWEGTLERLLCGDKFSFDDELPERWEGFISADGCSITDGKIHGEDQPVIGRWDAVRVRTEAELIGGLTEFFGEDVNEPGRWFSVQEVAEADTVVKWDLNVKSKKGKMRVAVRSVDVVVHGHDVSDTSSNISRGGNDTEVMCALKVKTCHAGGSGAAEGGDVHDLRMDSKSKGIDDVRSEPFKHDFEGITVGSPCSLSVEIFVTFKPEDDSKSKEIVRLFVPKSFLTDTKGTAEEEEEFSEVDRQRREQIIVQQQALNDLVSQPVAGRFESYRIDVTGRHGDADRAEVLLDIDWIPEVQTVDFEVWFQEKEEDAGHSSSSGRYRSCFQRQRCQRYVGEFVSESAGTLLFIVDSEHQGDTHTTAAMAVAGAARELTGSKTADEKITGVWRLEGQGKDEDVEEIMVLSVDQTGRIVGNHVLTQAAASEAAADDRFEITGKFTTAADGGDETNASLQQEFENDDDIVEMDLSLQEGDDGCFYWEGSWKEGGVATGDFSLKRIAADGLQWMLKVDTPPSTSSEDRERYLQTRWQILELLEVGLLVSSNLVHTISSLTESIYSLRRTGSETWLIDDKEVYEKLLGCLPPLLCHVDEAVIDCTIDLIDPKKNWGKLMPKGQLQQPSRSGGGDEALHDGLRFIIDRLMELLCWPSHALAYKALASLTRIWKYDKAIWDAHMERSIHSSPEKRAVLAATRLQAREMFKENTSAHEMQFLEHFHRKILEPTAAAAGSGKGEVEDEMIEEVTKSLELHGLTFLWNSRLSSCWEHIEEDDERRTDVGRRVYLWPYGEGVVSLSPAGMGTVVVMAGLPTTEPVTKPLDMSSVLLLEPPPQLLSAAAAATGCEAARFTPRSLTAESRAAAGADYDRRPRSEREVSEWSHKDVCEWLQGHHNPVCRLYAGRIWWPHPDTYTGPLTDDDDDAPSRVAGIDCLAAAVNGFGYGGGSTSEHGRIVNNEIMHMRGFLERYKLLDINSSRGSSGSSEAAAGGPAGEPGSRVSVVFAQDKHAKETGGSGDLGKTATGGTSSKGLVMLKCFEEFAQFKREFWLRCNHPLYLKGGKGLMRAHVTSAKEHDDVQGMIGETELLVGSGQLEQFFSGRDGFDEDTIARYDFGSYDPRLCGRFVIVMAAQWSESRNDRLIDAVLHAEINRGRGQHEIKLPDCLMPTCKADGPIDAQPRQQLRLERSQSGGKSAQLQEKQKSGAPKAAKPTTAAAAAAAVVQVDSLDIPDSPVPVAADADADETNMDLSVEVGDDMDNLASPQTEDTPPAVAIERQQHQHVMLGAFPDDPNPMQVSGGGATLQDQPAGATAAGQAAVSIVDEDEDPVPETPTPTTPTPPPTAPVIAGATAAMTADAVSSPVVSSRQAEAEAMAEPIEEGVPPVKVAQSWQQECEAVLSSHGVPAVYWPKVLAGLQNTLDEHSLPTDRWAAALEQYATGGGSGGRGLLLAKFELIAGQEVEVFSETKKQWSGVGSKVSKLDAERAYIRYFINGKRRKKDYFLNDQAPNIGDKYLVWKFHGEIAGRAWGRNNTVPMAMGGSASDDGAAVSTGSMSSLSAFGSVGNIGSAAAGGAHSSLERLESASTYGAPTPRGLVAIGDTPRAPVAAEDYAI